jgi:uncharacterized Zn finger protein (UPF0148 family)
MRDRDGREYSVAIGKYLDEVENEEEESEDEVSTKIEEETTSPPAPKATRNPSLDETEEHARKVGELLLKGWKMLGTTCPVTGSVPLMQNKEGRKYSVAIGKFMDELYEEEEEDEEVEEAKTEAPKPLPSRTTTTKSDDDASTEIGKLLMQGWTMLGESCPITDVPLMQNRSGRKYSVGLKRFLDEVDVEKELRSSSTTASSTTKKSTTKVVKTKDSNGAVQTLLNKVEELRVRLKACDDPILIKSIADAMLACSQSAKGIIDLNI